MSTTEPSPDINEELGKKLAKEGKNNPQAPYYGKCVAIVGGKVVAVEDNWKELIAKLDAIEPDPERSFVVKVGVDYDRVHHV